MISCNEVLAQDNLVAVDLSAITNILLVICSKLCNKYLLPFLNGAVGSTRITLQSLGSIICRFKNLWYNNLFYKTVVRSYPVC